MWTNFNYVIIACYKSNVLSRYDIIILNFDKHRLFFDNVIDRFWCSEPLHFAPAKILIKNLGSGQSVKRTKKRISTAKKKNLWDWKSIGSFLGNDVQVIFYTLFFYQIQQQYETLLDSFVLNGLLQLTSYFYFES